MHKSTTSIIESTTPQHPTPSLDHLSNNKINKQQDNMSLVQQVIAASGGALLTSFVGM
jgi:hypothetical protein